MPGVFSTRVLQEPTGFFFFFGFVHKNVAENDDEFQSPWFLTQRRLSVITVTPT